MTYAPHDTPLPGSPEEGMLRIHRCPMSNVRVDAMDGRELTLRDGTRLLDFATGAYLGLDADIRDEDVQQARQYGLRNGWSLATGSSALTERFQSQLAAALGMDGVVLSTSAALINQSAFMALRRVFPTTLYDEDVHVTLKQGIVAGYPAGARKAFRHGDLAHLEASLKGSPGPALVVVDGVYSMRGVEAPVADLVELCVRYGATLFIDDVHGFGVCGPGGLGVIERVDPALRHHVLLVAGFAKSASNPVAFLAFPAHLRMTVCSIPALNYSGPPSNLHVAICARHLAAFDAYADRRLRVVRASRRMHASCRDLGLRVLSDPGSPLLAVAIDDADMERVTVLLREAGILCKVAIFPVARHGEEALRFSLTASHTEAQLDQLEAALRGIASGVRRVAA